MGKRWLNKVVEFACSDGRIGALFTGDASKGIIADYLEESGRSAGLLRSEARQDCLMWEELRERVTAELRRKERIETIESGERFATAEVAKEFGCRPAVVLRCCELARILVRKIRGRYFVAKSDGVVLKRSVDAFLNGRSRSAWRAMGYRVKDGENGVITKSFNPGTKVEFDVFLPDQVEALMSEATDLSPTN